MPQTIEAINHSKAAGVPIIVAINKIDKPGVTQNIIGRWLSMESFQQHGVAIVNSLKSQLNLVKTEELLETVLLVAEVEGKLKEKRIKCSCV